MTKIQKWPKLKNDPNSKTTQIKKWPKFENDLNSKMTLIQKWPQFKNDVYFFTLFKNPTGQGYYGRRHCNSIENILHTLLTQYPIVTLEGNIKHLHKAGGCFVAAT